MVAAKKDVLEQLIFQIEEIEKIAASESPPDIKLVYEHRMRLVLAYEEYKAKIDPKIILEQIQKITEGFEANKSLSADTKGILRMLVDAAESYVKDFDLHRFKLTFSSVVLTHLHSRGTLFSISPESEDCEKLHLDLSRIFQELRKYNFINMRYAEIMKKIERLSEERVFSIQAVPPPPPPPPLPPPPSLLVAFNSLSVSSKVEVKKTNDGSSSSSSPSSSVPSLDALNAALGSLKKPSPLSAPLPSLVKRPLSFQKILCAEVEAKGYKDRRADVEELDKKREKKEFQLRKGKDKEEESGARDPFRALREKMEKQTKIKEDEGLELDQDDDWSEEEEWEDLEGSPKKMKKK